MQDELDCCPTTAKSLMSKAVAIATAAITFCYLSVGCLGCIAFVGYTFNPAYLVNGLVWSKPQSLFDVVLVCLLLHVCGLYQVSTKACATTQVVYNGRQS